MAFAIAWAELSSSIPLNSATSFRNSSRFWRPFTIAALYSPRRSHCFSFLSSRFTGARWAVMSLFLRKYPSTRNRTTATAKPAHIGAHCCPFILLILLFYCRSLLRLPFCRKFHSCVFPLVRKNFCGPASFTGLPPSRPSPDFPPRGVPSPLSHRSCRKTPR